MKWIIVLSGQNFDDMYFTSFFKAYSYCYHMSYVEPEYDHQGHDLTMNKAAKEIKESHFTELNLEMGICLKKRGID